ncbi:hypothetical protein TeGR_g9735 [Tetraparma gracilis]|uniref:26S proteasome non-ATPase regulatory subunit 1/RPN2 N-terminal domain-containing protein n=1 Tax=Tetraparma gracilis TaxID=2962635 RepID=A0ABQ6MP10_9STRA|nr:hypothetical protein TeGR_g9735 [Tetraparma gracilis]
MLAPSPSLAFGTPSSASGLLSLLSEPDPALVAAALLQLKAAVPTLWHEFAGELPMLEELAEAAAQPAAVRELASAVCSRVYFHLEEYRASLRHALLSGPGHWSVGGGDRYTERLRAEALAIYTGKAADMTAAGGAGEGEADPAADADMQTRVAAVVDEMFLRCYADGLHEHALGIALEARSLPKVREVLASPPDARARARLLHAALPLLQALVPARGFRLQVAALVADALAGLEETHGGLVQPPALLKARHLLGRACDVATAIVKDLSRGEPGHLQALQAAFDLVDTGDQKFVLDVTAAVNAKAGPADAADEEPKVDGEALGKVRQVLEGGFAGQLELAFM